MTCSVCRTRIDTGHSYARVERGALLPDGSVVARDQNLCSSKCLFALYGVTT